MCTCTQAADNWDLEKLYKDLKKVRDEELTPRDRDFLCGLLCRCSPTKIAKELHLAPGGVHVDLSNGLYRYVEQLTQRPPKTLRNWRDVFNWLEEAGYRNNSPLDTPPEPIFVGREGAIANLNTLVSAGAKVIGI